MERQSEIKAVGDESEAAMVVGGHVSSAVAAGTTVAIATREGRLLVGG
jgi:hypothetical protein